jgi:hypothetical protein
MITNALKLNWFFEILEMFRKFWQPPSFKFEFELVENRNFRIRKIFSKISWKYPRKNDKNPYKKYSNLHVKYGNIKNNR